MASLEQARKIFAEHVVLGTAEAISLGIAPPTLYRMRDQGIITRVSRGMYRLSDLPELGDSDLVTVAMRYPQAVISLISALNFFDLTDQVSHFIYVALPRGMTRPKTRQPPLEVVWLSPAAYQAGIRTETVDAVPVKIYDPEKTICDCFKFRAKVGEDVALEAMKNYLARPSRQWDIQKLLAYARIDRVERLVTPYAKALL